jgi:uncharacterized protein YkwD
MKFHLSLIVVIVTGITSVPEARAKAPNRIVIIDQVHCRSVSVPNSNTFHTVCQVRRIKESAQPKSSIPAPMKPPVDEELEIPARPERPEGTRGPGISPPPPLTEEQMPEGLKELPAPLQPEEIPGALPHEIPGALPEVKVPSRPPPLEGEELPGPVPKRPLPAQPMIVTPPLDGKDLPQPPKETRPKATSPSSTQTSPMSEVELRVIQLLNQERRRRGLSALTADPAVSAVARAHSKDMCQRGYFSHQSPEGKQPWDRLRAGGVRGFKAAAENIAVGYSTAQGVHAGWLTSPGHRRNRLAPGYTRIGVGLYTCPGHAMPYWTEVFVR